MDLDLSCLYWPLGNLQAILMNIYTLILVLVMTLALPFQFRTTSDIIDHVFLQVTQVARKTKEIWCCWGSVIWTT